MSNVVTIEELRLKHAVKEQPIQQGVKKVSVDDGFTAIPNELLFAIGQFGFTQRQFNVLIAVIQKTLSWRKEMDWISNSQLCELVDLPDEQKASKTKQELVRMKVLLQEGNKIGINLSVSEWKKDDCTKGANLARNMQKKLHKSCKDDCTKGANTKETITKEKINNPLPPCGESAGADVGDAPDEISRTGEKTKPDRTDYIGIAQAYNDALELTGVDLPRIADPSNLSDKRKRAVKKLSAVFKKRFGDGSASALGEYFTDFMRTARGFYFGENDRGWKADFEFLLRESTLDGVLEGRVK